MKATERIREWDTVVVLMPVGRKKKKKKTV